MISDLTYKIVAYPEIQQANIDESIDWANEMMELGYDSPSLSILAVTSKPANYFEVINYIESAVKELGLEMKRGDEGILSNASYYIQQIANHHNIRENLSMLYKFCQMRDYEEVVYDFYLLHWAWDELDNTANDYNAYWEGAKRSNIQEILVNTAKEWINKNRKHYAQH